MNGVEDKLNKGNLRHLNDVYVQRTIHLKVNRDDLRKGEYIYLGKNGQLDGYNEQNKRDKAECFAGNIITRRFVNQTPEYFDKVSIFISIYSNQCQVYLYIYIIVDI